MSHLNPTYTLPLIWILLRLQLTLQHPPHIPAMSRLFSVYFPPISPIFYLSFSLFPSHAPPASFLFSVFSPPILSACRALLINQLRRFPLNVRAVSAKIKLPNKYLQHCHILRTDKKNLSLLLLPS